jgi:glycosyltransferase involved in cell wall biosynthesis
MPIEFGLLRSFGFEVYMPKIIPNDPNYRSAIVDYSLDTTLSLDRYLIDFLNRHHFYEEQWSSALTDILNENFQLLISSWSGYTMPLFEAIRKFKGTVVARVFGREDPARYSDHFPAQMDAPVLIDRIGSGASKFWFGQAFDNLSEIEHASIQAKALYLPVGLPGEYFNLEDSWLGDDPAALFLCPHILDSGYYGSVYKTINRDFKTLPLKIFGRQIEKPDDSRVLHYLGDDELMQLYRHVRVMVYPSTEPRHLHYSPLEAMIVGCPVLYLNCGLLERLAGSTLPGSCANNAEMNEKAQRLLSGDTALSEAIKKSQKVILQKLSDHSVQLAWQEAMQKMGFAGVDRGSRAVSVSGSLNQPPWPACVIEGNKS